MTKRHRTTPLLRLLGWQCDPDLWTVYCRDGHGRRARILVQLIAAGVTIPMPDQGSLQLSVLQVGQLRAALRDVFLSVERLAGTGGIRRTKPAHRHPPVR